MENNDALAIAEGARRLGLHTAGGAPVNTKQQKDQ